MAFLYFAYGSNMWTPRMRQRCPSAEVVGTGLLAGYTAVYDKPSIDRSAKLNLRPSRDDAAHGVLYEVAEEHRVDLDRAEPGYTAFNASVATAEGRTVDVLTYRWTAEASDARPYHWYVEMAKNGAFSHGLPRWYIDIVLDVSARIGPRPGS